MGRKFKNYTTNDGAFQYGYVGSPADMYGTMYPFHPHWEATYLGDLTSRTFNTRAECLAWIREWYDPDVADNGDPRLVPDRADRALKVRNRKTA